MKRTILFTFMLMVLSSLTYAYDINQSYHTSSSLANGNLGVVQCLTSEPFTITSMVGHLYCEPQRLGLSVGTWSNSADKIRLSVYNVSGGNPDTEQDIGLEVDSTEYGAVGDGVKVFALDDSGDNIYNNTAYMVVICVKNGVASGNLYLRNQDTVGSARQDVNASWDPHSMIPRYELDCDYPAGPPPASYPGINVTILYPPSDSFFIENNLTDMNNNIYINGTFNTSESTVCEINDTDFTNTTPTGIYNFSFLNNTALSDGIYHLNVNCNLTGTSNGTSSTFFEIDLTSPTITINKNNFFNISNNTILSNYTTSQYYFNVTLTDSNLYAGAINITNSSGGVILTNLTTATTTTLSFLDLFDITSLARGQYNAIIEGSDSHTSKSIKDYDVTVRNDIFFQYIKYITEEGNTIIIRPVSGDVKEIDTNKYKDRYDFQFEYTKEKSTHEYIIESDNKIDYIEDSEDIAHFVILNGVNGNWIDFNQEGLKKDKVDVDKIDDYTYKVKVKKATNKSIFKSVGGLNYNRIDSTFIIGSKVHINGFRGVSSIIFDNFTIILNGTQNITTNTTNGTIDLTLAPDVYNLTLIPNLENWTTITGYLNVTDNYHNLSYIFTQTSSITINISDEKDLTTITETLDLTIQGPTQTTQDTTSTGTYFIANLEDGIHKVTIGNENYTSRSYYVTVTNTTSSILTAYLLRIEDGQNVLFSVRNTGLNTIEDVTVKYYRTINSVLTLISERVTDFAGQSQENLDPAIEYTITFNHSAYDFREIDLTPVLTFYTIILTGETAVYESVYQGIRFKIQKDNIDGLPEFFNVSNVYQNITFIVEGDTLEQIGINLTNHNYSCLPVSCENITTATGGRANITVSIMANATGGFNTQFFFKTLSGNRIYVNDGFIKVVPFVVLADPTLIDMVTYLKENTGQNTRSVIIAGFSLLATAIGSSLGMVGMALIIPALFVTIFASLPDIGLINPLLGLIMIIFSICMYVLSQLKET